MKDTTFFLKNPTVSLKRAPAVTKCLSRQHNEQYLWLSLHLHCASCRKFDGFVKSPTSVLRCILRHCGEPVSTPHSSGFARLEFEAFYFVVRFPTFYGIIKLQRYGFHQIVLAIINEWIINNSIFFRHYEYTYESRNYH